MEPAKRTLDRIIEWACMVPLTVMTILITFQVVVRYFFSSPSVYTESPSKYMFAWMVMYGSAYVFGLWEHMNIGLARDHMLPKIRVVVEMLGELMAALFAAGVMIFGGYEQATSRMTQMDAASQIPMGIIYPAVPVSARFILFHFVCNEMKLTKELRET